MGVIEELLDQTGIKGSRGGNQTSDSKLIVLFNC